jgi:hypothetical protein
MKRSSRNLLILLFVAIVFGAAFFYLRYRRAAIVEAHHSDASLLFQNPSQADLQIYFNTDSFELPPYSMLYLAVNSTAISSGKTHIKAIDLESRKLIFDTNCQLSKDVSGYFINPTLTNYVYWPVTYLIVQQADPYTYQPYGAKIALQQNHASGDTSSTNALIIETKECRDPSERIVQTSYEPAETEKGIVNTKYILSRDDFNKNVKNETTLEDFRKIYCTDYWEGYFFPERVMKVEEF